MKRKKYIKPEIERIHVEQSLMDTISVPIDNRNVDDGGGIDPWDAESKQNHGWGCDDFEEGSKWRSLWDDEE